MRFSISRIAVQVLVEFPAVGAAERALQPPRISITTSSTLF